MATLVFAAIASSATAGMSAGSIALAAGLAAGAGGIIDSAIMGQIFGGDASQAGPRLDDLRVSLSSEGAPMPKALGNSIRTEGVLLYASDLIETQSVVSTGGKGVFTGGGGEFTKYSYSANIAVAFNDGEITGEVAKIYADSKLIYEKLPDVSIAGNDIEVVKKTNYYGGHYNVWTGVYEGGTTEVIMKIKGPNLGTDVSAGIVSGNDIVVTGFAQGGNNGTFRVKSAKLKGSGISWVKCYNDACVNESAGASVTLAQTPFAISPKSATSVDIYKGTNSQAVDANYALEFGDGLVPAYRGTAYFFMLGLQLGDFGNRIPQLNIEYTERASAQLDDVIGEIMEIGGITAAEYDVTDLSGIAVNGIQWSGPTSPDGLLAKLLIAYSLRMSEEDGKIVVRQRIGTTASSVDTDDLLTLSNGQRINVRTVSEIKLPKRVIVLHTDSDNNYQRGAQPNQIIGVADGVGATTRVDLTGIILSRAEADILGRRMLWGTWAGRDRLEFSLPPNAITIHEDDVLTVSDENGEEYSVRVERVSRGDDFTHEIETHVDDDQTYTQEASLTDGNVYDQTAYSPPDLTFLALDIAALQDAEASRGGYYIATGPSENGATFVSAVNYESTDDSTFEIVTTSNNATVIGEADSVLADGPLGVWDEINTVTVEVENGTLSNATRAAVLAGTNWIYLGGEILGFTTATLVAGETDEYVLSDLIRGLRDTHKSMSQHNDGDILVLLDTSLTFRELSTSALLTDRYVKSLALGGDLADVDSVMFNWQATTLRPFSPANLTGVRDGSDDIVFGWERRSRSVGTIFGPGASPNLEIVEKYQLTFSNTTTPADDDIVVVVEDATTYTLTAAARSAWTADSDTVQMSISQVSSVVGNGNSSEIQA